jgi:hypothetical protein
MVVAMPKAPRRPDPEPLETNDRPVILFGMGAWIVAFVVLVVFFRDDLRDRDATYWLWACGIGVAMGVYGLHFVRKRNKHR